ncbi:hypothetical protein SAMN04489844_2467 [Nocardioides exalbidus]|uniref:WD40-like Beta Propeller Repeat n=1 Tax=Nocardioides exalbidus TaxID=402596 RepID=A0A1H4T945_9ACTN|nr:hypothetical protein [Nocardioides exalbidus]SEC52995.1 hypothetical protein SAMN04489844_2467 [Nocardioides exalbidus]
MKTSLICATMLALAAGLVPAASGAATAASDDRASSTVLDVRHLEQGAPPAIAWAERRSGRTVVHGVGGTTTPVPNSISELAPMGSGYVIQTAGSRPPTTYFVGSDGTPGRRTWKTGYGLAVSAEGRAVAFSGRGGKVWSIDDEGDRVLRFNPVPVPVPGKGRAVALVGESCKEGDEGNGCTIYVNGTAAGRSGSWFTSSHGIVDTAPKVQTTTTGRDRWLGGITSLSDMGSCSVMLRSWKVRWRTCDNQLSGISTDNRHVIGTPAYADGFGPLELDVLATKDGAVVHSFTGNARSATYFEQVWEDAAHVLVVTFQRGRGGQGQWAVVRLGVDGSMEYAVAPRTGTDVRSPFQLQTR